jgi:hypothetical protein
MSSSPDRGNRGSPSPCILQVSQMLRSSLLRLERRTEQELGLSRLYHVAFRTLQGRRRPDCIFSELNAHPAYPLVYASPNTSRYSAQDSRPSVSLLLSCEALSSSDSCRFIPAHRNNDFAAAICGPSRSAALPTSFQLGRFMRETGYYVSLKPGPRVNTEQCIYERPLRKCQA